MKEWVMIHKMKALYDNGKGSSIRSIANELGASRNTVRKYLRLDEAAITDMQENRERHKVLDDYRDYIIHLLKTYPRLSAVKVFRKLKEKVGGIEISDRTVRRHIRSLKKTVAFKQKRYYEPVLDMIPGVQCQVDLGELRQVQIGDETRAVYFAVFVLSYSRLMYVTAYPRPIDTDAFIHIHDAAFRYFGGCPEECVYDQTRLVVIKEIFRELELNQRFYQYAMQAGFQIRVCEGYDPESKGKVEAGVKYVKNNALYAETFSDWFDLEAYLSNWLEETANARRHGTTGKVPRQFYEVEELGVMKSYFTPSCIKKTAGSPEIRKVDKTGLISWQSNKYSVPMAYQKATVGVDAIDHKLLITDLETGAHIAEHVVCQEKGRVIKNNNHYRDHEKRTADLETSVEKQLGNLLGRSICKLLKATSPKIYKDQLAGLISVLSGYDCLDSGIMERLARQPSLTVTKIQDYLEAYSLSERRVIQSESSGTSVDLARYANIARVNKVEGGRHAIH
ncbi:MAG: integrase [delta proteobacterium ML8_D]|jgi:transposase|nr:MAG: integrase [delta proteobacterium ML8_D]